MATRKKARKTKKKTKAKAKPKPKKKAKPKPKKKAKPKKKPKPKKKAKPKKKPAPKKKAKKAVAPKKARRPAPPPKDLGDFSMESKVQRQKDVAWRMIDGEAVIITPADSTMHTLNDVGTRIWELMTGARTLREVAGVLCAEFEVDKDRAEKDTLWFAECLAKKGLIEYP